MNSKQTEYSERRERGQSLGMQKDPDASEDRALSEDNSPWVPFWQEIIPINANLSPSNRNCHTATIMERYLIIFGGKEGDSHKKFLNDIHVFDLENHFWLNNLKIEGMPPAERMGHTACLFGQKCIVIYAGWNGSKVLDDVYYLKANLPACEFEWRSIKTEGVAPKRQFHTANILDKYMYVFGGGDGKCWLNELHAFDLTTHKWQLKETKGKLPSGRLQHSSAIYDKKLYVFGGEPDRSRQLNDIHVLDLSTWAWTQLEPLGEGPNPRVSSSAQLKGNTIYFFGGFDGTNWKNDIFGFKVDDNMWETVVTEGVAPAPRCRHAASVYKDAMVIFGGNDSEKSYNDIHILNLDVRIKIQESTLVPDMHSLFQDQLFSDVTFNVQGVQIPAHKAILAARCEQFKAMFTSELRETNANEIIISDTRPDVFKVELTEKAAIDLLIEANKYMLPRLKELCEQFIAERLSVKNIIEIINIAELHEAQSLKECALNFMLKNKNIICETQDLTQVSKSILLELYKRSDR